MNPPIEQAHRATLDWLKQTVIGLHLCPFAHGPLKRDAMRIEVCPETDEAALYQAFLAELQLLAETDRRDIETALLVFSHGLTDFERYLGFVELCEQALAEAQAERLFQLASFHPDYHFDGSAADDAANYTNRSPFPMIHFIRADMLEQALAAYPRPEQIPLRNIERLRGLGLLEMQRRLAKLRDK